MWERDCQVVCVNNKEIIGLCSPGASLQQPEDLPALGGARTWHYTQLGQPGGQKGEAGVVPAMSFMKGMSLSPRLSQSETLVTGKGPELGRWLEMKGSCESPADLRAGC